MAASGTDKKITAAELAIALGTTLGVVGRDKIWDAAGDVIIGTGANTAERLAIGTAAGAALVANPNATNEASIGYPHGVEAAVRGRATSLASTFDRGNATETNITSLSTARLSLFRIALPAGLSITNISFTSMTTALAVGLNQWFALFDNSYGKLAVTADDTTTAWAANTRKSLAVASGPFVTTYSGIHYVGICVVATTVPTLAGQGASTSNFRNVTAAGTGIAVTADTGLTNPASCPTTATATASLAGLAYVDIT